MKIESWPQFDQEEQEAVIKVLKTGKVNYWTGSECKDFESQFSKFCNVKFALCLVNGSIALESSYEAIGLQKEDELITTPRTFIATTMSAIRLGIKPVFADVDEVTGCITAETIEPLITKKTKAISVVHLGGWPANMQSICDLAKSYNLYVIEDCAQAHGAKIKEGKIYKSVGSYGDIGAWSFCQDKIISTGGEGGMITTNSEKYYEYIWSKKDHGKTLNSIFKRKHPTGYRWVHDEIGTNYRMTEIQAAIGKIQIKRLANWKKIRERNAKILFSELSRLSVVRIPFPNENVIHAWYKFYCFINENTLSSSWNRNKIIEEINALGFPAYSGTCSEIYLEKAISNYQLEDKKILPIAKQLGETSIMLLIHPTISKENMIRYAQTVKSILERAQK